MHGRQRGWALAGLWLFVAACNSSDPIAETSDAAADRSDADTPDPAPDATEPTGRILIAHNEPQPQDMVVDDAYVYWVNDPVSAECPDAEGSLRRRRKDLSQPVEELATGLHHPIRLVADDGYVYVLDYGCSPASDGKLMRIPKIGGIQEVLASGLRAPVNLDLAGDYVYWIESISDGSDGGGFVKRVNKAGGSDETLASEQNGPFALRVRDDYVYWTTMLEDSNVWRLQRPAASKRPWRRSTTCLVRISRSTTRRCTG